MERDPAKAAAWRARSKPLRRGKRLAPVSEKRLSEKDRRAEVRALVLARAGYRCEARNLVPEVRCWHPPGVELDVDEVVPRGVYPGGHLDPDNCQALCRAHHDWKHAEPEAAVERGLRRWSWDDR